MRILIPIRLVDYITSLMTFISCRIEFLIFKEGGRMGGLRLFDTLCDSLHRD